MLGFGQNRALKCDGDASSRNLVRFVTTQSAQGIVAINAELFAGEA